MSDIDLRKASGEDMFGKSPRLDLNQIRLNGQEGKYIYRDIVNATKGADGRLKIEEIDIGDSVKVVFLKIRRILRQFRKDKQPLQTNEHNHKGDYVTLYGGDKVEQGTALDIRLRHPELRTSQIVYALYKGELVKLIFKGASLGSESKADGVMDFYQYIASYKTEGKDEHFYEWETVLDVAKEKSSLGSYFVVDFKKGKQLEKDEMKLVAEKMQIALDACTSSDKYYNDKAVSGNGKSQVVEQKEGTDTIDTIEYPDEDSGEIPFS